MQNFPVCTSGCGSQNTKTPSEGVTNQTSEDMDFSTNAVSKFTSSIFPGNVLSLRYSLWVRREGAGTQNTDIQRSSFASVEKYTLAGFEMLYYFLDDRRPKKANFFKGTG